MYFRAGQVGGIPIRLHASWLLLLVLGISTLQPLFAQRMGGSGVPLALVTTLLLVLSILLHEVGHALVARRLGLRVATISLFLTGGLTEIEGDVAQPGDELKISLAGPAVSGLLALLAAGAAWWSGGEYQLVWGLLAAANGLLAVFNLLPCYPLDGGRALRAMLWFLHDDLLEGTRVAALIGRGLGGALMLLGIVVLITADPLTGFFVIVLGWMLSRSAMMSYAQAALHYTLSQISVGELMSRSFRTVSPQLTLDVFVGQYLLSHAEQGFPVVQAERLLGVITVRNLRRFSMQQWRKTQVSEAMIPTSALPTIHPNDTANVAYHALLGRRLEQLPVTDGDNLLGMIRHRDVLQFVQKNLKVGTKKSDKR